jgi:hypothetical protein
MKMSRRPPLAPPAFGEQVRADVAAGALSFGEAADVELVIGLYARGFEEAFNMFKAKGGGVLFLDFLGWGEEHAPQLLAALEHVRDHYPAGGARMAISLSPNAFSDGTKAAIHRTCERYARLVSV